MKYEAEETIPFLVQAWVDHHAVPHGAIHGTEVARLDALPFPAWDLIDLPARDRFSAQVIANLGRGPWAFPIERPHVAARDVPRVSQFVVATHCSSNPGRADGEPKTQRRYSAERLRAYLSELVTARGATRFECLDELINVNERHWDAFLEDIEALDARFDCPNGMRADYLEGRAIWPRCAAA